MTRPHIAKSEQRDDWETPRDLFHGLDDEFGPFDMDAAAEEHQYTAQVILGRGGRICVETPPGAETDSDPRSPLTILYDAFKHPWGRRVFLNPPYSRKLLPAFVAEAQHEAQYGVTELVCALLPSRTGTKWWQDHVCDRIAFNTPRSFSRIDSLQFLRGRLKFVGAGDNAAPFASVVVVWRASE